MTMYELQDLLSERMKITIRNDLSKEEKLKEDNITKKLIEDLENKGE